MTRPRRVFAVLAAICCTAGCASIPDSGAVVKVEDDASNAQSTTRFTPVGPAPDATPQQIVDGFVEAQLAYPADTGTAAAFLTSPAAKDWRPADRTIVYASLDVGSATDVADSANERSEVTTRFSRRAVLDSQGAFESDPSASQISMELELVKGQWRISNPPDGMLVSERYFRDYFRPYELFYFDRPGNRLVAVPVYLRAGDQMPTELVRGLLESPGEALGGEARSYLSDSLSLRGAVTQTDGGLVEIEIRQGLGDLTESEQERASAQLVWTMRQVEGVTGVRIVAGNTELNPDGNGPQELDAWSSFAPRSSRGAFFALQGNRVVRLDGADYSAVPGAWGDDALGARRIAVDGAEERIAAVTGDGRVVMIGALGSKAHGETETFEGTELAPPEFDSDGRLWMVDHPQETTSRVRVVDADEMRSLDIGSLAERQVTAISISPDGARYAAIAGNNAAGSEVFIGAVRKNDQGIVIGLGGASELRTVDETLRSVRSPNWDLTSDLTVVVQTVVSGPQVYTVRIDGSQLSGGARSGQPLMPTAEPLSFVSGGSARSPMYVSDADDVMWFLQPGGSWSRVSAKALRAPIYTG